MASPDQGTRRKTGMHQTTLRFGSELWEQLDAAAQRSGISIAQYVREAAVGRLARAAAMQSDAPTPSAPAAEPETEVERAQHVEDAHLQALSERDSSSALWAQNLL